MLYLPLSLIRGEALSCGPDAELLASPFFGEGAVMTVVDGLSTCFAACLSSEGESSSSSFIWSDGIASDFSTPKNKY